MISKLPQTFSIRQEQDRNFRYFGLNITFEQEQLTIDQNDYINQLTKLQIDQSRKCNRNKPLLPKEIDQLRAKTGQLLWTSSHTRPEISCRVSFLASKLKNATIVEFITVNKVINKVKADQYKLKYLPLDSPVKPVH